jgi:hypothetical protein
MISADLSLPEWNWLGPWFAAAHARFANDPAAALAVSCFTLRVATFIDVGLIVAGAFDPEHPGRPFLIEPVHPQTGRGHGRRDMQ